MLRTKHSALITAAFLAAIIIVAFSACSPSPRIDPPVLSYDNALVTQMSAEAHAKDVAGSVYVIAPTGSMEPTLTGGDWVVVRRWPFGDLKDGQIIVYKAEWAAPNALPVCHRIVGRDGYGLILSGDANPTSEARWRVTDANYIGAVVAIYRTNK